MNYFTQCSKASKVESFIGVIATFLVTQSPQWFVSKYGSTDTVAAVARWLDRMFPTLLTRSWQANYRNLRLSDYCHVCNRSSLKAERIDSSIHNLKKTGCASRSAPSASRYQAAIQLTGVSRQKPVNKLVTVGLCMCLWRRASFLQVNVE